MRDHNDDPLGDRSLDPLRQASMDSQKITEAWLIKDANQPPIQRIGHGLISIVYVGAGLFFLVASLEDFEADDRFWCLGFGVVATFFLYFGIRGFWNVLRFRKEKKED